MRSSRLLQANIRAILKGMARITGSSKDFLKTLAPGDGVACLRILHVDRDIFC